MKLVVDASAVIEVVLSRPKASQFLDLIEAADQALAPELLVCEVVNAVWKYHQFENLSLNDCDRALEFGFSLVDSLVSCAELYGEAFLLARTLRRSAYDMFYFALARREDAAILTLDASLRREAAKQGIRVL